MADELQRVLVAGGEQDSSFEKFRWLTAHRGVDVVQPDVVNNGGFIRTLRVARLAAAAGIDASFQSARADFAAAYMLHLTAATPNLGRFQEFLDERPTHAPWYGPSFSVRDGVVAVPTGPGLGVTIDPQELRRARRIR